MASMDRYDKADLIAIIGMATASVSEYTGYLPESYTLLGVGGMGLAALAIFGKLYVKHKATLVAKVDGLRHKIMKSEHEEGDHEAIEDIMDAVAEVIGDAAEDVLDDGELNNSN
jgi:hypothetical protein